MAGGVNDIDLHITPTHCCILGHDRDALLALQVIGVHDAVNDLLILAIHASLLQHVIDEGGLAMVNVSDDGDVANVCSCR